MFSSILIISILLAHPLEAFAIQQQKLNSCRSQIKKACAHFCEYDALMHCAWLKPESFSEDCKILMETLVEERLLSTQARQDCKNSKPQESISPPSRQCKKAELALKNFQSQANLTMKNKFDGDARELAQTLSADCE